MACEDTRQLTEAQRQAAYQQQRTGVQRAVRPFTGRATLDNLIDYINRELQPAVRATRDAVNEVYLPVVDNAPSANPLAYYFSTETGAADPTAGRIRLNQATQDTATIIRLSEDNARLQDVLPWLEVMAGGVTAPLGVITLYDAVNPARFLRFDLESMTDQGAYWDLGVTVVESSHDNPFVDGGAVTLSYIPGVADNEGSGAVIPPGSIEPIATDTFLGNISGSTAAPSAVPLANVDSTSVVYDASSHTFQSAAKTGDVTAAQNSNAFAFRSFSALSVLARATNSSGVPTELAAAANDRVLARASDALAFQQVSTAMIADDAVTLPKIENITAESFLGNFTASSASPTARTGANIAGQGLEYVAGGTLRHSAKTVTDEGAGGTFNDYALGSTDHLRVTASASFTGFAGGYTGRHLYITIGTGLTVTIPNEDAGSVATNGVRTPDGTTFTFASRGGIHLVYDGSRWRFVGRSGLANNDVTDAKLRDSAALSVIGRSANSSGDPADISTTISSAAVLRESGGVLGFGTVATAGIADDAVTNAKLANMAEATIKGRAAGAGTGDPTDLTGAQVATILALGWDDVLANDNNSGANNPHIDTGQYLGFGVEGSVPASGQLRSSAGWLANVTGDFQAQASSGINLCAGHTAGGAGDGDIVLNATSGIALTVDATTPVTGVAGIAITTGTGNITQSAATAIVLNTASTQRLTIESDGSWNIGGSNGTSGHPLVSAGGSAPPAWGQLGSTGIADAAVTLAKQANLAQSTIIGRAEGAGTGVPQALTPTQVVSIIDGESPTWTASHRFDSFIQFGALVGGEPSSGDIRKFGALSINAIGLINISSGLSTTVQSGGFGLNSVISPTALSADQNNYSPTGWDDANVVRLSCSSATDRAITGAAAGSDGEIKLLFNVGSAGQIQLKHEDAASSSANRFRFASLTTFNIDPEGGVAIWYDGTSDRWRALMPNIVGTLP